MPTYYLWDWICRKSDRISPFCGYKNLKYQTTHITIPQTYHESSINTLNIYTDWQEVFTWTYLRELSLLWHSGLKSLMKEMRFLALSGWHQKKGLADKGEDIIPDTWYNVEAVEARGFCTRKKPGYVSLSKAKSWIGLKEETRKTQWAMKAQRGVICSPGARAQSLKSIFLLASYNSVIEHKTSPTTTNQFLISPENILQTYKQTTSRN